MFDVDCTLEPPVPLALDEPVPEGVRRLDVPEPVAVMLPALDEASLDVESLTLTVAPVVVVVVASVVVAATEY